MLMIPPALTTKSGAHRIPRAARTSAMWSSASWLFAAPAMIRQRSRGTVSSSNRPPRAQGASTSTSASSAALGRRPAPRRARRRAGACARRRRSARAWRRPGRSAWPPASQRGQARSRPAIARAATPTRTPARSAACTAASTPSAVNGLGSPDPPRRAREPGDVRGALGDHAPCRGSRCPRPRR